MNSSGVSVIVPVFNGGRTIGCTLQALQQQNQSAEILVVDDGSQDDTVAQVVRFAGVRLVKLDKNSGRAAARNAGAAAASQPYLVFLDNDCLPTSPTFLTHYVTLLDSGANTVCGPVLAEGNSFWSRYQQRQHPQTGEPVALGAFTAANFAIKASLFHQLGGFDARYRGYGFEDRDLYARLLDIAPPATSCVEAAVTHYDTLNLTSVWHKMHAAGGDSAARFRTRHPQRYREMRYWRFDARAHRVLRPLGKLLRVLLPPTLPAAQNLLDAEWIPYRLRRVLAQGYSAAAFLSGSCEDNIAASG